MPERAGAAGFDPVVFDLDGTVVDTVELIVESFRYATRTVLGEVLPDEVIIAGVGQPLMAQMEALSAEHAQELYDVYREYNHRRHDELIRGYDGRRGGARRAQGRRPPARHRHQQERATRRRWRSAPSACASTSTSSSRPATRRSTSRRRCRCCLCLERLGATAAGSHLHRRQPVRHPGRRARPAWRPRPSPGACSAATALLAAGPDFWLDEPGELLALCLRGEGAAPCADGGRAREARRARRPRRGSA